MMGIGRCAFNLYSNLYNKGFFSELKSVIELGSQEIQLKHSDDFLIFLKSIKISDPQKELTKRTSKLKRSVKQRMLNRLPGKILYELMGINQYESIDSDGVYGAHVWDLNKDISSEYKYTKQFDLVTNHGTTEHVFNQDMCFKNIHNLTKVGGYMLHGLPFLGYVNHSFFLYQPSFFLDLAAANNYKIEGMWLIIENTTVLPYSDKLLEKYRESGKKEFALFCLLKKLNDSQYKTPFQGRYAHIAKLDWVDNIKFKTPKKPIWMRLANKILDIKL